MPKIFRVGLVGLIIVVVISLCVGVAGGEPVYTAPLAMPFALLMLIGWNMRDRNKE